MGAEQARVLSAIHLSLKENNMPDPTPPAPPKPADTPFWLQAPIWVMAMLVPLVYIVCIMVLWPANGYSTEVKVMVVTAVVGLLGLLGAYWFANSNAANKANEAKQGNPVVTTTGPATTVNTSPVIGDTKS